MDLLDADVPEPMGTEVWHLVGDIVVDGRTLPYDQRLVRSPDGAYVMAAAPVRMRIDPGASQVRIFGAGPGGRLFAVTTYAIPVLLNHAGVFQLHGCAAIPPGGSRAVVVCGTSGTGKSTLLLGLIEAGWRPVSEDIAVIDERTGSPHVWPGPPWVRRAGRGPAGSVARFANPDKTAWDIASTQVDGPVPVAGLVFLESAGGSAPALADLDRAETIKRTVGSAMWLIEPERRAAATFVPAARLAAVGGRRLRLPRSDDWAERAAGMLASV